MKNKRNSNYSKEKGVYPHDYMDCFEKLSETTLPPIESFYLELNKSGISEHNYTHAQKVWETFEMETLQDYHDLYLNTDVLLLKFVESKWLEPYINTNLRMQGKNNFEKDFFKLMNNSVFGKTMENIRNRVDIHLVTDEKQGSKFISKPNYNH